MVALLDLRVAELALDPNNPRLPEDLQGASQERLLEYLYENGSLDELARSFADNGYFQHEPLIVAGDEIEGFPFTTLEGNRRLATLKILLGLPPALGDDWDVGLDEPLSAERAAELASVPCYRVESREEVHKYLGFRHIGGIKTWSAEAKARYLLQEVDKAHQRGDRQPFLDVARRVGSNTQGVRNSYLAIAALRHGRDEFGIDVGFVLRRRFGVWLRCMNVPDLRSYVGLDSAKSYEEVRQAIQGLHKERLQEVLTDLTPADGTKAVLEDSRDVTSYGRVLANDQAHAALRKYSDLRIAQQVVERAELPLRIERMAQQLEILLQEIQRADVEAPTRDAIEHLYDIVLSIRAVAKARLEANA